MDFVSIVLVGLAIVAVVVALSTIGSIFFVVRSQSAAIIERFGKFNSVATEGLNLKIPFIDSVVAVQNLRISQLVVEVETKTKDNVFVTVQVAVQYQIIKEKIADSFYKLQDLGAQVEAYVFDVVRSEIPKMELDDVFLNKDSIAGAIKENLAEYMDDFGLSILKSLVTDIDPADNVKASMNEINAAERLREAEVAKADANKIRIVKEAEADAESKQLQGRGLANQRREIANGLKESIEELKKTGVNNEEVLTLLLITQHYDAIESLGKHGKSNTIMVPYSSAAVGDMRAQISEALLLTKEKKD